MPDWTVKRLASFSGDRRSFVSGDAALDEFFLRFAGQFEKRRLGVTWIASAPDEARAAGYYTSAASSVPFEVVPIKLTRHPVPTILIARLAVDQQFQRQGVGEHLLLHALKRALDVASDTAVWAVTVDAYTTATSFYARYGFKPLIKNAAAQAHTVPMFLPMKEIEKFPFPQP